MNTQKASFKDILRFGSVIRNPVLVQVAGICPVVAATTSVINAVSLSLIFMLSLVLCETLASLLFKKFPRWVRMGLYPVINLLIVFPVMYAFEYFSLSLSSSLGIYLPLMVMNALIFIQCETFAVKNTVKMSFFDALACSVGYGVVLIGVGTIREIFGSGTFLGVNIPFINGMSGLLMPFGGLFIIGVLAAFHKWWIIHRHPENLDEIETKFTLDESKDTQATFTYALKNRFSKKS